MLSPHDEVGADLEASKGLSDYEAVEVLWVALIKAAHHMPGSDEHRRMLELVSRMPDAGIRDLLHQQAVDVLLALDPPLETVLADQHERLYPVETKQALNEIATLRDKNGARALVSLGSILKRIRNKRAHGFKARGVSRDAEILGAARPLLLRLCRLSLNVIKPNIKPPDE